MHAILGEVIESKDILRKMDSPGARVWTSQAISMASSARSQILEQYNNSLLTFRMSGQMKNDIWPSIEYLQLVYSGITCGDRRIRSANH